ncbi:hypothetical protein BME96_12440 [Virgibacillus halodenitrificans]|uniref:Uncharacterized protein n=1 Tax=Virgibacillus halodenitrificans TaxID=1482 RepID=A0AAC9IZV4_VIRHA|nr:hypothetical protein [Virgibacillus halodenitrificans]APC48951.1 hypothetical protein BME96_12440 [Virgibacillus halodenitrificans]
MIKVLVIVTKNGTKYQIGIDKPVPGVLKEISKTKGRFYLPIDSCAIDKNEIVSVEQYEFDPKEGENNG